MELKEFVITGKTKNELSLKIETLFNWQKKRISNNYISFTNFEKIYFHTNGESYYAYFEDTKTIYEKALKLKLI